MKKFINPEELLSGIKLQRKGWHGAGMHVVAEKVPQLELPVLFLKRGDNYLGAWNSNQADLLADDWQVVVV